MAYFPLEKDYPAFIELVDFDEGKTIVFNIKIT